MNNKLISDYEHQQNFLSQASAFGNFSFKTGGWILDSRSHPIDCADKEHKGKAHYIGSVTNGIYNVTLMSHAHGNQTLFSYNSYKHYGLAGGSGSASESEIAKWHERNKRDKAARDKANEAKERAEKRKKAANVKRENKLFTTLSTTPHTEPTYFDVKKLTYNLKGIDIRYGADKAGEYAAVQLTNAETGAPCGLQKFYADGDKRYSYGVNKSVANIVIGKITCDTETAYVCEGIADGILVNLATGAPTLVTLDAAGMVAHAPIYKEKYPYTHLIFVADNDGLQQNRLDRSLPNTGVLAAVQAAKIAGGRVAIPEKWVDISDIWMSALSPEGGFEAILKALKKPQSPPSYKDEVLLRLGWVGKKDIEKAVSAAASLLVCESVKLQDVKFLIAEAIGGPDAIDLIDDGRTTGSIIDFISKKCDDVQAAKRAEFDKSRVVDCKNKAVVNSPLLNEEINEEIIKYDGVTLIKSGMATGKTSIIGCGLKEKSVELGLAVNYVVHRVSLTRDAASKLRLNHYQDVKYGDLENGLAICVNSIGGKRFQRVRETAGERTMVIIDEISQVYRHLATGSVTNPNEIFDELTDLIKKSNVVVGMDADMDQFTLDLVAKMKSVNYIENTYKTSKMGHVYSSKDALKVAILDAVKNGEKVAIATDSKGWAKAIFNEHQKEDVLLVDGDNIGDSEQVLFMNDVNKGCKKLSVLIYTPAISSGVSIEINHFDRVFGMFEGTIAPADAHQMMGRVRAVGKYDIFLSNKVQKLPTDDEKVANDWLAACKKAMKHVYDETGELVSFEGTYTDFDRMAIKRRCLDNAQRNNFKENYLAACIANGDVLTFDDDKSTISKETSDAVKLSKLEAAREIATLDELPTEQEIERIEKKSAKTSYETKLYTKHSVQRAYGLFPHENPSIDNVLEFDDGRGLVAIKRLDLGVLTLKEACLKAKKLMDGNAPLTRWKLFSIQWFFLQVLFKAVGIKPVLDGDRHLEISSEFFGKKDLTEFANYMSENAQEFDVGAKFGCKVPKNIHTEPVKFVRTWLKCCGLRLERDQVKKGGGREYRYRIDINPQSKNNCIQAIKTVERRAKRGVNAIEEQVVARPSLACPIDLPEPDVIERPQGGMAVRIFDLLMDNVEDGGGGGISFKWLKYYFDTSEKRLRRTIKQTKCIRLVENDDEFRVYLKTD